MRLRLRIERNALPPVQTLWPVKDTSCTIAQLLQQINDVFPLEADTWGLEHYALTLAGYDLLHYHVLKDALKDEDELVIKPLKWEDLRSRTMTGRDQISVDGRHLVDGVPFGRPALRAPTRPEVRIPPRKKRRLELGEELLIGEEGVMNGTGKEVEEDFAPRYLALKHRAANDAESNEESDREFDPDMAALDTPTDSEQDSWHSHASIGSSSSEEESSDGSSSSGDSSSDSSSDSDEEEWEGIANGKPSSLESKTGPALPNGVTQPEEKDTSQANSVSTSQSWPSAPADAALVGVPYEGTSSTQHRNARRRDAKRLAHAKRSGTVPQDASLADFRAWLESGADEPFVKIGEYHDGELAEVDEAAETSGVNGHVSTAAAKDVADPTDHEQGTETSQAPSETATKKKRKSKKVQFAPQTSASLEERRQQLVAAIKSGGVDVDGSLDEQDAPEELTSKEQPASANDSMAASATRPSSSGSDTRRAKLDLAGSQRLLYGSLGVRVPKTQAEKDALQKKLSDRAQRKAIQNNNTTPLSTFDSQPSAAAAADRASNESFESWRDRLHLTAVECVDEDVTLSEPPFPFHQRWDPQYNRKGKKRASSTYMENGGSKKRKRGQQQSGNETYDKYNADGYGDALNYDDDEEEDEYWEDGALLNGASDNEAEDEAIEDDFPPLPADITTLPLLTSPSEAKANDIITFTELACDESTGWQPQMIARTAKVLECGKGGLKIQLSTRDVKPPSYDEEGNRVWGKFEMPDVDGEGEGGEADESVREVVWGELGEVRMVLRAAAAGEEGEVS